MSVPAGIGIAVQQALAAMQAQSNQAQGSPQQTQTQPTQGSAKTEFVQGQGGVQPLQQSSVAPDMFGEIMTLDPSALPPHLFSLSKALAVKKRERTMVDKIFETGLTPDEITSLQEELAAAKQAEEAAAAQSLMEQENVGKQLDSMAKVAGQAPQQAAPAVNKVNDLEMMLAGVFSAFDRQRAGEYGAVPYALAEQRRIEADKAAEIDFKNQLLRQQAALKVQEIMLEKAEFDYKVSEIRRGEAMDRKERIQTRIRTLTDAEKRREAELAVSSQIRMEKLLTALSMPARRWSKALENEYARLAKQLGETPEMIEAAIQGAKEDKAAQYAAPLMRQISEDVDQRLMNIQYATPEQITAFAKRFSSQVETVVAEAGEGLSPTLRDFYYNQFAMQLAPDYIGGVPYKHLQFQASLLQRKAEADRSHQLAVRRVELAEELGAEQKKKIVAGVSQGWAKLSIEREKLAKSMTGAVSDYTKAGTVVGLQKMVKVYSDAVAVENKLTRDKKTLEQALAAMYEGGKVKRGMEQKAVEYKIGIDNLADQIESFHSSVVDAKSSVLEATRQAVATISASMKSPTKAAVISKLLALGVPQAIIDEADRG